ncbi:hypothetical protein FOZ60_015787 [Perkinsus olseni]|uniref:Uncharacterized protein n=1 Tax=Perkinsus olseni TaxID=32597 RepID=A0A7J6N4Z6_PEROL|nr:hypothetical protein FOZ60_015787 [Perkinsus olseni]KAF4710088.1 hypothetical protein FOZ62_019893 [Perkinsus olseni]
MLSQPATAQRLYSLHDAGTTLIRFCKDAGTVQPPLIAYPVDLARSLAGALLGWIKFCAIREGHLAEYTGPVAYLLATRVYMTLGHTTALPEGFPRPNTLQQHLQGVVNNLFKIDRSPQADIGDSLTPPPSKGPSVSQHERQAQQWAANSAHPPCGPYGGGPNESYIRFRNDMQRMRLVNRFDDTAYYFYTMKFLTGVALREVQKALTHPGNGVSPGEQIHCVWNRLDSLYL